MYTNCRIKTFVELSLSDMSNMLRVIPVPAICLQPHVCWVTDPKAFVKIVNDHKDAWALFDFTPYIRKHSINNEMIRVDWVYRLADEISLFLDD